MSIPGPYLLFLGATTDAAYAKTAFGLRDWAPERCLAQLRLGGCTVDLGLPDLAPAAARAAGARTLLIGVAPIGGALDPAWLPVLEEALAAGLDLAAGMHQRLNEHPRLASATARHGRQLVDVRVPPVGIPIANGRPRSGRRVLTVGTDCAVGKKYTALALWKGLQAHGLDVSFRASGQTGIMITGEGIPMDAVVSDFLAGAAEQLSPAAASEHWDVIEGQGSLFHPAYAGVALGLLQGSQPEAIVVCHDAARRHIAGYPEYPVPALQECIERNLQAARLTSKAVRCVGVSINTRSIADPLAARNHCESLAAELGLPVVDPIRDGVEALLSQLLG